MAGKANDTKTFIGAIIVNSAINSVFVLNNISVFMISYLHHFNPYVNLSYSYFLYPFCVLGILIANYVHKLISNLIHSHIILGMGALLIIIALILLVSITNIYIYYFAMLMSGFGMGLITLISFAKAYYSRRKASNGDQFTNMTISSISNILSALLSIAFLFVMNPTKKSVSNRGYFTYSISQNISTAYAIMIAVICVGATISVLMIDKVKPVEIKKKKQSSLQQLKETEETEEAEEAEVIPIDKQIMAFCSFYPIVKEQNIPLNKSKKRQELEYNQAIHSIRLYRVLVISFTSSFLENLIFIAFIPYASMNGVDYSALYYSTVSMLVLSSIIHPIYKYLADKLSLRKIMLTKSVISLLMGCLFTISKKFTPAYLLICFMAVITNTMREGSLIKHLETSFNDAFIYRYLLNSNVISFVLSAIFIGFIPQLFNSSDDGYFTVFLFGGLMNMISFLLVFWEGNAKPYSSVIVSADDKNVFY